MHQASSALAFAATISSAMAAFQGFNYGSTFTTGAAKQQTDFEAEFKNAQNLVGAPGGGFTSARLYTTIQAGTSNSPIAAIPAAISTKTSLLLGLWASGGDAALSNEISALKSAIQQYGTAFTSLVAGISVGSEDLYRISPTGIANHENPGADPLTIVGYIKQVRDAISGTPLSGAQIGHVDTWTAWVNGSNQAVIDACDWLGVDAYPYFQETQANSVDNAAGLFNDAFGATKAAGGAKPVWVTETGFPVSGKTVGQAVPSLQNAKTYWDQVGCPLFGSTNVWWYTMQDALPDTPNPSFGLIGNQLTTTPVFDLSCSNVAATSSSSSSSVAAGSTSASSTLAGSSKASSSIVVPTNSAIGGGSPGASSAVASSQLSLETSTISSSTAKATGTGSSATSTGSSSGSGSNNTASGTTPRPTTTPSTTASGGAALAGSMGAAAAAIMAAIFFL